MIIPCVRELIALAECADESYITFTQAFFLLKKLRIATPYVSIPRYSTAYIGWQ